MDDEKLCPQCGAANSPDAVFCDCGHLFSSTLPSRQRRRLKKRYLLYGVIALLLLSIVAVAVSPSQPVHTTSPVVPSQHVSVVELAKTGFRPAAAHVPKRSHKAPLRSTTILRSSTTASKARISASTQQGAYLSNVLFVQPAPRETPVTSNAPITSISYPYESVGSPFNAKLADSSAQGYGPWLDSLGTGGLPSPSYSHPGSNVSGQAASQINHNTDLNQNINKLISTVKTAP